MEGDNPLAYETEVRHGKRFLKQRPDGSCVYLGKNGCRIHGRAPEICRFFDCRRFAQMWLAKQGYIGQVEHVGTEGSEILLAGLERLQGSLPK